MRRNEENACPTTNKLEGSMLHGTRFLTRCEQFRQYLRGSPRGYPSYSKSLIEKLINFATDLSQMGVHLFFSTQGCLVQKQPSHQDQCLGNVPRLHTSTVRVHILSQVTSVSSFTKSSHQFLMLLWRQTVLKASKRLFKSLFIAHTSEPYSRTSGTSYLKD